MRILYAEDEPDMNELVSRALREEQYAVDSCVDGMEAIECFDAAIRDHGRDGVYVKG